MQIPAIHAADTGAATASLKEELRTAWHNHSTSLSVRNYRLDIDQLADIYYETLYRDGEFFYVDSAFSYATSKVDGTVTTISIRYSYTADKIPSMIKAFNNEVQRVTSQLEDNWTTAEKILYFHEYLSEKCEYDTTYNNADAYTAMIDGLTVCQGYALAMCTLCESVGIPCYTITSDEINHMWNVVNVDGNWYHLDVTYDDSAPDMLGHTDHEYLLRSTDYMMHDPYHYATDWHVMDDKIEVECSSDAYDNAFWTDVIDTIQYIGDGQWEYAQMKSPGEVQYLRDINSTICIRDTENNITPLKTVSTYWDSPSGAYTFCYVASQVYQDKIYYHTPTEIRSMSLTGKDDQLVYTLSSKEKALGQIYGFLIDANGLLTYQIQAEPQFADENYTVTNLTYHTLQLERTAVSTTTTPAAATTATSATATTSAATTSTIVTTAKTTTAMTPAATTSTTVTTAKTTTAATPAATTSTIVTTAKTTTAMTPAATTSTIVTTAKTTTAMTPAATTSTIVTTAKTTTAMTPAATTSTIVTTAKTTTAMTPAATTSTIVTTAKTTTAATPAATTSTTVTTTATAPLLPGMLGDVNCDSSIDVADAVMLARFISEDTDINVSGQGLLNANVNRDSVLDAADIRMILSYIANLILSF